MAEDEASGGGIAVAELDRAEEEAPPKRGLFGRRKRKDEQEDPEHEFELMTPFGKLELEFEPTSRKERREQKKRAKEQAAAEKEAAKQQAKALKQQAKKGVEKVREEAQAHARKGGAKGKIALILLAIALVGGAIALAYWLFARTPEDLDKVPEEYRADEVEREPEGFVAKARQRMRHAVRAGQRASRDAQLEQQQRYEEMTRGG